MICELWRLAMALQLLVFTSRVYKWSIDPVSNPKPRRESRDNMFDLFMVYLVAMSEAASKPIMSDGGMVGE
jgi:hypothetical protein